MRPLYEISTEMEQVLEQIAAADGEMTAETEELLAGLSDDFAEKAKRIEHVLRNLYAEIESRKVEEKRLRKERGTAERRVQNLRRNLLNEMQRSDIKKVGPFSVVRYEKTSYRYLGDDPSFLPSHLCDKRLSVTKVKDWISQVPEPSMAEAHLRELNIEMVDLSHDSLRMR